MPHLTDAELLLSQESEAPPHLAQCPVCQRRLAELTRALTHVQTLPRRSRLPLVLATAAALSLFYFLPAQRPSEGPLPNPALTPGLARHANVCASQPSETSTTLALATFARYKIANPTPGAYEVDYLISPALGGVDSVDNLWPQPYSTGVWNSHVKDALEDYLLERVCSGRLDLGTAQKDIAANWIAAYRKYFHTNEPLPAHAGFIKDRPWQ